MHLLSIAPCFSLGLNIVNGGSFGGIFIFFEQKSGQNGLITSDLDFRCSAES
jgi:hypothetical protein